MRRGRISIREKIEHKHGPLWSLLKKHCSECETPDEACNVLNEFTNDPNLVIRPNVLENTIKKSNEVGGIEEIESTPFLKLIKKGHGKGKQSIQSIIEAEHGDLWVLIHKHCQNCLNETSACEALNSFTNDSGMVMKPQVMLNTITRAKEKKKITGDEFFVQWTIKKRRKQHTKKNTTEIVPTKEIGIEVHVCCQNCEHEDTWGFLMSDLLEYGIGIRARQCPHCKRWGTFNAHYVLHGEEQQEYIENWMESNPSMKGKKQTV